MALAAGPPGFELALFALILVLPQVDLPDFTFSGGSAPVAVHSRLCSSPLHVVAAVVTLIPPRPLVTEALGEILAIPAPSPLHDRLSRLCILIC
jgi:hypothetical protein